MHKINHASSKTKRVRRVRGKIFGTQARPRLSVYRSNKHVYLQVIDDDQQATLVAVSDRALAKKGSSIKGTKTEKAQQVAQDLATKLKTKKVTKLAFDRGSYKYHGRVKAIAEILREAGVEV